MKTQTDGTLVWSTRLQMWSQGLRIRVLAGLGGGFVFAALLFSFRPPLPVDLSALEQGLELRFVDAVRWELAIKFPDRPWLWPEVGHKVSALPEKYQLAGIRYTSAARKTYWQQFPKYGYSAMAGAVVFFSLISFFGWREEERRASDQYVRGAQLATPKELSKLVRQTAEETGDPPPRLSLGGVSIPVKYEITPWSIVGRPQVGKSTLLKALLDQIIEQQTAKRIVFCSKGDYTKTHLQIEDKIFAPSVDSRSIRWTIFNDITSLSRISDMVAALIPEGSKDPIWSTGARLLLEGLLLHCWHSGKKSNAELWKVACLPADKLKEILVATPGAEMAAALLDKPEVTTSFSFTVNLKTYLKPLQLLAKMDGPFSVRDWLTDGKSDGLFIVSIPDHLEALKPVMNLFLSTLLTAHKSLADDRSRRIFYMLDELAVLPKVPGLETALSFGPSKGLCAILGFQSYQQIEELYGRNVQEAMVSSAGLHGIFSVGSERSLESLSKLIGEAEVIESRGTLSTGITDQRHGASSMDQLVKRRLVLPDEIKDLQPLNAYIKLLGYPAARIKLEYKPYPSVAAANIPDPTFDLDTYLSELTSLKAQADALPPAPASGGLAPEQQKQEVVESTKEAKKESICAAAVENDSELAM